jgi:hypothetical protein
MLSVFDFFFTSKKLPNGLTSLALPVFWRILFPVFLPRDSPSPAIGRVRGCAKTSSS